MRYLQIILLTVCTACISFNISAQSTQQTPNAVDQEQVHISKINMLKKIKSNIERKQTRNSDNEENGRKLKNTAHQISKPSKNKKPLETKLPKKIN